MEQEKNVIKSFIKTDYNDEKLSKEKELNSSMSINNSSADIYTNKIHNIGGGGVK